MKSSALFPPSDRRRTVTIPELAELTGFSKDSIWRSAVRGEIPGAIRTGPRTQWRFDRQSLEAWWPTTHKTELIRPIEIKPKTKTNRKNGKKRKQLLFNTIEPPLAS